MCVWVWVHSKMRAENFRALDWGGLAVWRSQKLSSEQKTDLPMLLYFYR